MDYIPYIPKEPPEDIVKFALSEKMFRDYLIFKCSDSKRSTAVCHCTACGQSFEAQWGKTDHCYGGSTSYFSLDGASYKSWDTFKCPFCGEKVMVRHTGGFYSDCLEDYVKIQVFSKKQELFIVSVYSVCQRTDKKGGQRYEVLPYEHFVFENRVAYTIRCYGSLFSNQYPQKPHQLSKFTPPQYIPYTYPYKKDFTAGTYMENSRLEKYLKTTRTGGNAVQYLRTYQSFKRLDALMDLPFGQIFVDEIDRGRGTMYYTSPRIQLEGLNRKEKSPYKMLGIDRSEAKIIPWEKVKWYEFADIKKYKDAGGKITAENIEMLLGLSSYDREDILKNVHAVTAIKYLSKDSIYNWRILKDYWRMAAQLGYDLDNPVIRYPGNLIAKHDDVMKKVQYQENKEKNKRFEELAQAMDEVSCNDGSICIRAAASNEELKAEGKALKHCVGGYGEQHCSGKSIFFVRQAEKPDVPWYTLQVNLKTGRQIQLHGYHNELDGQEIPQAVFDFVDWWLKNIFRRFDVDKMKFIDKPSSGNSVKFDFAVNCKNKEKL